MEHTAQRYEAICDASPDAILLVDDEGIITYANARVDDMLGYDPVDLVGTPIERLVPEPVREGHVAERNAYIADPETRPMGVGLDLSARCADGSTVPVDISLSPIAGDGETAVMAAVRDVSDRTALQKTYRTILAAVPDPVLIADAETGEIVEANDQVGTLLGYDPDELVGETQAVLHPDDEGERYRDLFARHVTEDQAIFSRFSDGSPIYAETASGERVPVEINARVFELANRRLVAGVFRDISDRWERERQLRDLHETTRNLMNADEPEAVATLVADAADRILGYASTVVRFVENGRLHPVAITEQARAEMGERPDYPLDGENPASRVYQTGSPLTFDDARRIDDGYDRGGVRSAMYVPIGDYGVLSVVDTAVGAFDQSDAELAAILAANAETALARLTSERELERQNERLDEFATVVAHDVRNPLSVAQGWLEVVREETEDERLDRVENALVRIDDIIDDTLTLARQGRAVADQERISLGDLARESWDGVSTNGANLNVTDGAAIRGDRDRVRHVFENLFRNSVEHGSTGNRTESGDSGEHSSTGSRPDADDSVEHEGVDVTVTVGPLDDGFYVEDDGPGIPPEKRASVFDPGETSMPGGTGFGLSIVQEIAAAHGWTVVATESEDGGARFEFTGVDRA